MIPIERWPDDGRTSQERWNGMTASQQHGYVMRLEHAVLEMGKEIGKLRQQHPKDVEEHTR